MNAANFLDTGLVNRCNTYLFQVTNTSVESDFFSSSNVVSFSAGQTSATAVLLLQNDAVPEGNETFIVEITGTQYVMQWSSLNSQKMSCNTTKHIICKLH